MPVADRRRVQSGLFLSCLLLAITGVHAGAMYRWTDAEGGIHFSDQPGDPAARPVDPDNGRLSIVDTVVVKENAMRSVVQQEVARQQRQRAETLREAAKAEAAAARAHEKRCATLRRQMTAAEDSGGSLIDGRLNRLDDLYGKECR